MCNKARHVLTLISTVGVVVFFLLHYMWLYLYYHHMYMSRLTNMTVHKKCERIATGHALFVLETYTLHMVFMCMGIAFLCVLVFSHPKKKAHP